jgi:hypothetical protein
MKATARAPASVDVVAAASGGVSDGSSSSSSSSIIGGRRQVAGSSRDGSSRGGGSGNSCWGGGSGTSSSVGGGDSSCGGGDCGDCGLLHYEKLLYLFYRYLHVSPGTMQKCRLHDSVRYQNSCSRDPITLSSMDIVVETFLEIGVSDLLVSAQRLQDPLYMEV